MDLTDEDYDITNIFYDAEDDKEDDIIYVHLAIRKPSIELKKFLEDAQHCSNENCHYVIDDDAKKCKLKDCDKMVCKKCIKYSDQNNCCWCNKVFCEEDILWCDDCGIQYCSKCLHKHGEFDEENETLICKNCKRERNGGSNGSESSDDSE
jgi:hypothetical protein